MTQAMGVIYGIRFIGGDVCYVGQTRQKPNRRWAEYRRDKTPIARLVQFFGPEAWEFFVIEEISEPLLNEREEYWICQLGTLYPKGLNHRAGGNASQLSSRVRSRISEINRERWADPVYRVRVSAALKSSRGSPESRLRVSADLTAMWKDPEFRERRTVANKKIWSSEERRAEQSARKRALWANPEWREKTLAKRKQKAEATACL